MRNSNDLDNQSGYLIHEIGRQLHIDEIFGFVETIVCPPLLQTYTISQLMGKSKTVNQHAFRYISMRLGVRIIFIQTIKRSAINEKRFCIASGTRFIIGEKSFAPAVNTYIC